MKSVRGAESKSSDCAICQASIRAEIEAKDNIWKPRETVLWARKQGLYINGFMLAKHRANHVNRLLFSAGTAAGRPAKQMAGKPSANGDEPGNTIIVQPPDSSEKLVESAPMPVSLPAQAEGEQKSDQNQGPDSEITDELLLNAIRDRVYRKLVNEELELKIDSAFKAIELKHKIAEESQNEKLLLEILSELRAQEIIKAPAAN
jgi:hypothetical protein